MFGNLFNLRQLYFVHYISFTDKISPRFLYISFASFTFILDEVINFYAIFQVHDLSKENQIIDITHLFILLKVQLTTIETKLTTSITQLKVITPKEPLKKTSHYQLTNPGNICPLKFTAMKSSFLKSNCTFYIFSTQ